MVNIGTKYKDRKTGLIFEVIERLQVVNSKGEIERTFYRTKAIDSKIPCVNGDVCELTILKGVINE